MIIELYTVLLILTFVVFATAFFKQSIWFWAIVLVLSGSLIFGSFNIEQNILTVANQTAVSPTQTSFDYQIYTYHNQDWALFSLNLGIFLLSLALFMYDLFNEFRKGKLGSRDGSKSKGVLGGAFK